MDDLSSIAPSLLAGQTIDTQLTTNCNAQTQASFDFNDSTWVTFYYQNKVPLWRAMLSIATQEVVLLEAISACGITLNEGLRLTLNPMGTVYTVLLYGTIVDAGVTYKCDGTFLGSFSRSMEMKIAVRAIRLGRIGVNAS